MGKTVRVNNTRIKNGKGCKRFDIEDQMLDVKSRLDKQTTDSGNDAQNFLSSLQLNSFCVDTKFPNQFNETAKDYVTRNVSNYDTVVATIDAMLLGLNSPVSVCPTVNDLMWLLMSMDHTADMSKIMFDVTTVDQKKTLMQILTDEAKSRITSLNSIITTTSITTTTTTNVNPAKTVIHRELKMNTTTDTTTAPESETIKPVEQASPAADNAATSHSAAKESADKVYEPEEVFAEKPQTQEAPTKGFFRRNWKFTAIVAVGAAAYLYSKHRKAVNGAVLAATNSAGNAASEQVVGG